MSGKIFGCVFCEASGTFSAINQHIRNINQHIRNIHQPTRTNRQSRKQYIHSPEIVRAVAHATTPEPAFTNEVSPERIKVLSALAKLVVRQLTGEIDVAAWGKRNIRKYSAEWWAEQVDTAVLRFRDSGSNHDVLGAHLRSVVENAVDNSLRPRDEALPRAVRDRWSSAGTSPLASSTYLTMQDGYSTFGTGSANTFGACPTRGTGSTNTFGACPTRGTGSASTFKGPSMGDRNRLREHKRTYVDVTESTDEGSDSEVSVLRFRDSGSDRDVREGHLRSGVESTVDDSLRPRDEALPRAVRAQRSTAGTSPLPSSTCLTMQDRCSTLDTGSANNTYGACPTRGTGSTNTFGACPTRATGSASTFKGPSMGDRNRLREHKRTYIDRTKSIDEGSDIDVSAPPPAKSPPLRSPRGRGPTTERPPPAPSTSPWCSMSAASTIALKPYRCRSVRRWTLRLRARMSYRRRGSGSSTAR